MYKDQVAAGVRVSKRGPACVANREVVGGIFLEVCVYTRCRDVYKVNVVTVPAYIITIDLETAEREYRLGKKASWRLLIFSVTYAPANTV